MRGFWTKQVVRRQLVRGYEHPSSQSLKSPPPARAARTAVTHPGQFISIPLPKYPADGRHTAALEERCAQQDKLIAQLESRIQLLESQLQQAQSANRYRNILGRIANNLEWLCEEVESFERQQPQPAASVIRIIQRPTSYELFGTPDSSEANSPVNQSAGDH